jgi:drug/metabolite transporter (DMT)-like permease
MNSPSTGAAIERSAFRGRLGALASPAATMLLVAFFWGAGFASSKAAVSDVPPLVTGTMRYVLTSLVLVPLYLRGRAERGEPALPPRSTWLVLGLLALTAVVGYNVLYFVGLTLAPSSDAILLIPTTNPIWTMLFAGFIIAERPPRRILMGVGLAVCGMALVLVGGYQGELTADRLLGSGLLISASIIFGFSHVMSRIATRSITPLEATTLSGVVGGLVLGVLALGEGGYGELAGAPALYWFNIGVVAFGTTAFGYVLFYRSISRVGPGVASFFINLVPIFGLILSAIFLGEIPTPLQVAGASVVVAAVVWATRPRRSAAAAMPATAES